MILKKYSKNYRSKDKINITDLSVLTLNYKSKGYKNINNLQRIPIKQFDKIKKYFKGKYDYYNNRYDMNLDYYSKNFSGQGWFFIDKDEPVGYIIVWDEYIAPIRIFPNYQGYKLSKQMIDVAVKELGACKLRCYKYNAIALKVYKKYGFQIINEDKNFYYMELLK